MLTSQDAPERPVLAQEGSQQGPGTPHHSGVVASSFPHGRSPGNANLP